jgi:hypothetical protein
MKTPSMKPDNEPGADAGISTRTVELAVAALLFTAGAIVVVDSYRLGSKWGSDGPQSGYFPFYIGLLLCVSSIVNFVQALRVSAAAEGALFVAWGPLKLVLTVLIPAAFYVLGVKYFGIYLASAVYIAIFMVWLGHYSWLRSVAVGLAVNVSFFLMFEVWFQVPLYKGDLEPLRLLGY